MFSKAERFKEKGEGSKMASSCQHIIISEQVPFCTVSQVPPIGAYEVKWLDTSNGPVSFDKSERFRRSTESLGNKAHQETRVCKHLVESTT